MGVWQVLALLPPFRLSNMRMQGLRTAGGGSLPSPSSPGFLASTPSPSSSSISSSDASASSLSLSSSTLYLIATSSLPDKGMMVVAPICMVGFFTTLFFFFIPVVLLLATGSQAVPSSALTHPSWPGKQMTQTNQCACSLMGTTMKSLSKMFTFLVHFFTRSYRFSAADRLGLSSTG